MKTILRLALVALLAAEDASAAPESVDLLVRSGTVVTMDGEWNVYENGFVAIRGGRIIEVGDVALLAERDYRADEEMDAGGKAILPGLVNTHGELGSQRAPGPEDLLWPGALVAQLEFRGQLGRDRILVGHGLPSNGARLHSFEDVAGSGRAGG